MERRGPEVFVGPSELQTPETSNSHLVRRPGFPKHDSSEATLVFQVSGDPAKPWLFAGNTDNTTHLYSFLEGL